MASILPWAAITATQPLVWVALGVAAAVSMPLLLGSRRRRESLSGKHVLITGGSEGVGLEVAKIAAARGARVSLVARTMSKLHAARDELASSAPGAAVGVFSGDVGDGAALGAAIEQAESQLGPVDVCIAAAGAAMPKYFEELRIADYERMMTVNYYGVLHAARHVLPKMAERSAADPSVTPHFVAVASMVAAVPFIGYAAYAPSKAACRSLLDVLRNEYADTAVQLHIAFPPDMDTPGFQKEQETKPYETRHIWPEMFNELFPPDKVASRLLDDLFTARGVKRRCSQVASRLLDDLFTARGVKRRCSQVASRLLDDLLDGRYFLGSPDLFGDLLVTRAWGHYPRARPLLEAALAPLFVGLHCVMVWMADRVVKQRKHHGGLATQGG